MKQRLFFCRCEPNKDFQFLLAWLLAAVLVGLVSPGANCELDLAQVSRTTQRYL